uniref:N-lysine methyltransferase SETD6 n=1 Tax=Denticeps clupeoides TaxID=299321 RepID=A0AAY4E470_9TELE
MATDPKRPKLGEVCGSDAPLANFLSWCERVGLTLSPKVYVSRRDTVAEYGMLAKEDIGEGEVLFTIPRDVLLSQDTSKVKSVLEQGKTSLENASGWVSLLLALMYEYTRPHSHWRPYLSLWPDFKALDHPMFWSREERESLLKGTGIPEAVETDLANLQTEYRDVVLPFMRLHPDLWDPEQHTLDLYKSLVAFIMAYSFQEPLDDDDDDDDDEEDKVPNPPMMVPMADMLNHVSNHNANLEYMPDSLRMVAVRDVRAGEEVFNTYGQMANWQLLHMYGFVEPHQTNSNDTADVQTSSIYKAAEQRERQGLLVEKWKLLCEMDMVGEKGTFIFGKTGCLTDTELYTTLKILCMQPELFVEFKENEGWEEAEDENEEEKITRSLSIEGLPALDCRWKQILHVSVGFTLDSYGEDIQTDRKLLGDETALANLSSRARRALHVRHGQKCILQKIWHLTQPTGATTQSLSDQS